MKGMIKMLKYHIVQLGKYRSVVCHVHQDTKEIQYYIFDNSYLMELDDLGLIA